MQKFLSLGTECLEFRKAADESKDKCFLFFLIEYICCPYCFSSQWICLLNIVVSLANALSLSSALEAKLKASTKALGEADKKHGDKVAATNLASDRAVKEAEARATKAEISKKQSECEEAVVKHIDDLLTAWSCLYYLFVLNGCSFMMKYNNLEKSLDFVRVKPKILCLMFLACWSQTIEMSGTFSSALEMCFPACLPGCSRRRGMRCRQAT
jgi:hypothetical protein